MNEGKGWTYDLAIGYKNGSISKQKLKEICERYDWDYKFDNKFGVVIIPRMGIKKFKKT